MPRKTTILHDSDASEDEYDNTPPIEPTPDPPVAVDTFEKPDENPVAGPAKRKMKPMLKNMACQHCGKEYAKQVYLTNHEPKCVVGLKAAADWALKLKTHDKKAYAKLQRREYIEKKKAEREAERPVEVVKKRRGAPLKPKVIIEETDELDQVPVVPPKLQRQTNNPVPPRPPPAPLILFTSRYR